MTAIALFWERHEIVVAADGLEIEGDGGRDPVRRRVCKIRQAASIFYVMSGVASCDETGFDAHRLIQDALEKGGTIREAAQRVEQALETPAREARGFVREHEPAEFEKYIKDGLTLNVGIFGAPRGRLAVSLRGFGDVMKRRDSNNYSQFAPFLAAPGDTLSRFQKRRSIDQVRANPRAAARAFVELAIADTPDFVGPPIHLISVTASGAQWIERSEECFEIAR